MARLTLIQRAANQIIGHEVMFFGTVSEVLMYPREIVKGALLANASAVIVAHNHPSGNPVPSPADKQMTNNLVGCLKLIDVRLLDHLIITEEKEISMQTLGLIQDWQVGAGFSRPFSTI